MDPSSWTTVQVMLELATIAYSTDVTAYLGQTAYWTNGWQLAWGPATAGTNANLVYVAQNASANQFAVAVRGTYPEFGAGLLQQLREDLDVDDLVPWPNSPVPNVATAEGTSAGLNAISQMTSGGLSLTDFLAAQAVGSSADIFVTGHSLGGCLVTVLAPWLLAGLGAAGYQGVIRPYTYAAPTAGNAAFAAWFDSQFAVAGATRVVNRLDIVPMAWNNLPAVKTLFPAPGPSSPVEVSLAVDVLAGLIAAKGYDQPASGVVELTGAVQSNVDFFTEALNQHAPNNYLTLLGAPMLPFPIPPPPI
jgi:hypothetical protein